MGRAREIDVIDVNRLWSVWVGTRAYGYRIGSVRAHDRLTALRTARAERPGTRVGYVLEDDR